MKIWTALLLLCASPALARIGDTRAQCEARYGKGTVVDSSTTHHAKASYEIQCTFHEGMCDSVSVCRREDPNGNTPALTAGVLTTLLASFSGGMTWTQVWQDKESGAIDWECPTMEATYSGRDNHLLIIGSRDFFKRRQKNRPADEPDPEREARERLEGF